MLSGPDNSSHRTQNKYKESAKHSSKMSPTKAPPNKKRKPVSHDHDSQLSNLVHMAKKEFHKQGKVVKSFECQKMIKKIKALTDTVVLQDGEASSKAVDHDSLNRKRIKLEDKLAWIKAFSLDTLVHECLRRVGLVLNTTNSSRTSYSEQTQEPLDDKIVEFHNALMEDMLGHKRLKEAMERWNQKYTDFRIRLSSQKNHKLQGSDTVEDAVDDHHNHPGKRKRNDHKMDSSQKKSQQPQQQQQQQELDFSNLFVDSLSGKISSNNNMFTEEEDEEFHMNKNIDDDPLDPTTKKKNRMGQKQRKAKAMAMEAKKTGKIWDQSVNWRAKKNKDVVSSTNNTTTTEEKSSSGLSKGVAIKVGDVVNMGTSWKEEGKAHPSWAAREALKSKSSIVAFTGKKITFE